MSCHFLVSCLCASFPRPNSKSSDFSGLPSSIGGPRPISVRTETETANMEALLKRGFLPLWEVEERAWWYLNRALPSFLKFGALDHGSWPTLAHPTIDNLVEGKRKRRSNVSSPATPTASTSSTAPTRKMAESPRASMGVPSGKRKLIASEEERSPAKRGRKSAAVKPGECSLCLTVLQTMEESGVSCQTCGVWCVWPGPLYPGHTAEARTSPQWSPDSLLQPPAPISQQSPGQREGRPGCDRKHLLLLHRF